MFDPPGQPLQPPSLEFPLGTDDFGEVGPRPGDAGLGSLLVGFTATVMTMTVGAAVGIGGGYFGGRTDTVLNAFTNWFLVMPWIPSDRARLDGPIAVQHDLVIGLTSWAGTAARPTGHALRQATSVRGAGTRARRQPLAWSLGTSCRT